MSARLYASLALVGASTLAALAQEAPRFSLPLSCEPGRTCFIQHYVDVDQGPDVRDFRCGTATYDGHTGVDFRLLSTAAARRGVSVIAAAPGIVRRTRDGMTDAFARDTGMTKTSQVGCGNAVVIEHGGGWQTTYCHMRQGTVAVKDGQRVERGNKLGEVGWSGLADFAHVHFQVRKDGRNVDPFTAGVQDGTCSREPSGSGLWQDDAARAFPYRNGEVFDVGFADREPVLRELEHDHATLPPPGPKSPVFLIYARIMNVQAGDRIRLSASGPGGFTVQSDGQPLDRTRPLQMAFAGKRLTGSSWPSGRYLGRVELVRGGEVVSRREIEHEVK